MTLKSFAFTSLFLLSVGTVSGMVSGPVLAQQNGSAVPANFPPASFSGLQYVDNKGCIYVRAGFDGNVTWVPRVTRQRQPICGQTPTFGSATAAAPAPSAPASGTAPVQITLDPPAAAPAEAPAATVAAATAPVPRVTPVIRPTPAPTAAPTVAPRVVRAPASKPVTAPPPRIVRKATVAPATVAAAPAASPSRQVVRGVRFSHPCAKGMVGVTTRSFEDETITVRCAPQSAPHVTITRQGNGFVLADGTRIVPKHVYTQRVQELGIGVPKGYRPAWDDDRLNPHRALQTVEGYRATQQVWSNTVPRETISSGGQEIKQPVVAGRVKAHSGAAVSTKGTVSTKGKAQSTTTRIPTVSSRSQPQAVAQYVRVGAFTTEAKAKAAAARLQAAGLPVRFGRGKGMTHVLVGPYSDAAAAQSGLKRTHRAGYVQAVLR